MKDSSTYTVASTLSLLLIGPPGSGKTGIAAAFPDPYFLEVDKNLDSAVRVMKGKKFWYDHPTDMVPEDQVWSKSLELLKAAIAHPEIKTIIVDSFSQLAGFARASLLANLKRIGAVDAKGRPLENLRINDYLTLLDWFRQFVFALRASSKHVIVTSHQQLVQVDESSAAYWALAIPGQSKDSFAGWFGDAWGCMSEQVPGGKTKFVIKTRPAYGTTKDLKTTMRTMPETIDVTNLEPDQIWSKISPFLAPVSVSNLPQLGATTTTK